MKPPALEEAENVAVAIRCRPFSDKEVKQGCKRSVILDETAGTIQAKDSKQGEEPILFTFDYVFGEQTEQMHMYNRVARHIIDAILEGYNGTIFAYGQTGTGKTYAMEGIRDVPERRGISYNAFDQIFSYIGRSTDKKFLVTVSYLEIYMEKIRDLLSEDPSFKLDLREDANKKVYVQDLTKVEVKSLEEIAKVIADGAKNRSVGATAMNLNSSRSHAILTIDVECSEPGPDGKDHILSGRLNLVDLAGSERQGKTEAKGERLKEASSINKSLLVLGQVIKALAAPVKGAVIPYRESKLTRLLQDSLGGTAKTLMLATIGPADYNADETIGTLRYADRAKSIQNKLVKNLDPKDAMLMKFQEELERLKKQLAERITGQGPNDGVKPKRRPKTGQLKKIINEAGEEVEVPDEEEGTDTYTQMDPEEIRKMEAAIAAEKQAVLKSKDMLEEDRKQKMVELERKSAELQQEKVQREEMAQKLHDLQSRLQDKLLIGGVNIKDHVSEQTRRIQEQENELEEKRRREREIARQVEEKQFAANVLKESFKTAADEVAAVSKKLKQIVKRLKTTKLEINDIEEDFQKERDISLETIRSLNKDLLLRQAIIDTFIPSTEVDKIKKRSFWDEEKEDYMLQALESDAENRLHRPKSVTAYPRPLTKRALNAMMEEPRTDTKDKKIGSAELSKTSRLRPENILIVGLDLPEKTTKKSLSDAEKDSPDAENAYIGSGQYGGVAMPVGASPRFAGRSIASSKQLESNGPKPPTTPRKMSPAVRIGGNETMPQPSSSLSVPSPSNSTLNTSQLIPAPPSGQANSRPGSRRGRPGSARSRTVSQDPGEEF